jgi:predicted N-acetyltransferase YhbS
VAYVVRQAACRENRRHARVIRRRRRFAHGTGVGRALMSCLLQQLRPVPVVTLFCSQDLVSYYEAFGFHATRQMVLHRS